MLKSRQMLKQQHVASTLPVFAVVSAAMVNISKVASSLNNGLGSNGPLHQI